MTAGDPVLLDELLAAAATLAPGLPLDVELEIETGLGRGGFSGAAAVDAARRISRDAGLPVARPVDPPAGGRGPRRDGASRSTGSRPPSTPSRGAGIDLPPRHVAASAALLVDGVAAYDGVRPGLAVYGLAARRALRGRDLAGDLGQPPPGHVARRPAGPRRRPAGRLGDQLRPDLPDLAAQPDRDAARSATATAGRGSCRTGRRRSSGASGCRSSATWRWTRSWPT